MILPKLRSDQRDIALHPAKVKAVCMGRRWGKTVLGGTIVGNVLRQHGRAAWVTPTYKNSRPLWRWITTATIDDARRGRLLANKADRTVVTDRGGFLGLYSADNIDSIRGEWFHLVVIDEAAFIPENAWTDAIMPTLADANGDAVLIGTPKGRNWFYYEYQRGRHGEDGQASWQAPTTANPLPTIRKAAKQARHRVSDRTYRQEWLAEFLDDGELFRYVSQAHRDCWTDTPRDRSEYAAGLDWAGPGGRGDWTVLTILDVTNGEVAYVDRFNGLSNELQRQRIAATCERFSVYALVAEDNAMGRPNNELLYDMGLPVNHFTTTNKNKTVIIESLATAFDAQRIGIPQNHEVLTTELESFEAQQLPSGLVRYSAPAGLHDDCVMSLALAWSAKEAAGSWVLFEGDNAIID
jgi:phage terminase large subunit-like protein